MVTRRSIHANHAQRSAASKRHSNRRNPTSNSSPYAAGKPSGAQGGYIGNIAGFGSTDSSNSVQTGMPRIENVAGLGSLSTSTPSGTHRLHAARKDSSTSPPHAGNPTPKSARGGPGGLLVPTPNGGEVLLTRRHFLFGALGVGAVAAAAGGGAVVIQKMQDNPDDNLVVLEVPESAVISSDALAEVAAEERMGLIASCELPFGSLVWANDDNIAACLLPTQGANPLSQVALLTLSTSTYSIVLEAAVGNSDGFEIYDVRATSSGLVWTEADILDGVWRVYSARSDGTNIGQPALLEEGDANWETPTIAAAGNHAFWQVLPKIGGEKRLEQSVLKRATMGASDVEVICSSTGRMATPPYALDDSVVVTPRTNTSSIHYQLTRIDAVSGEVLDTMTLPTSMKPLEAGYGKTGFSFSFDVIYNYGNGIANLGTYTPMTTVTDGDYSGASWLCFSRAPTAAPAWCGSFFMVKSTYAVCGIDPATREYFTLNAENGADSYGEYLASTGSNETVVTYANIDDKPLDGASRKCCLVRTWGPLA